MKLSLTDAHSTRRGNRLLRLVTVMSTLVCATAANAGAQARHDCLAPDLPDSTAQVLQREAISILSEASWSELRTEQAIPAGSASDVSIVQDNAVCNAAMAAFEARTGKQFPESFVIVRMGQSSPFYLMTPRREGALTTRYLLNAQFVLLEMVGT